MNRAQRLYKRYRKQYNKEQSRKLVVAVLQNKPTYGMRQSFKNK